MRARYEHIWLVQAKKIPNILFKNRETPGKSVDLATLPLVIAFTQDGGCALKIYHPVMDQP